MSNFNDNERNIIPNNAKNNSADASAMTSTQDGSKENSANSSIMTSAKDDNVDLSFISHENTALTPSSNTLPTSSNKSIANYDTLSFDASDTNENSAQGISHNNTDPTSKISEEQGTRKSKKKQKKAKKSFFGTLFKWLFYLGSLGAITAVVALYALYQWAAADLPSFSKVADYRPAQVTTVLARDGSLIGQFYREKRYLITINQMAKHVPLAFLAVEDSEFYTHPGINFLAIARAFIANLQSGSIRQGGSTITQQVVKRLMLTPEKSYERKIKEAILSFRIEEQLSKDDILTIYLNQIFLGNNAYGIESAARTYFGKHALDLSIAEAAMLAGLPQSPSANNPFRHPKAARERQEHVLRRMRTLGWITDEEFDKAFYEELKYQTMPTFMGREGGWYLEEVRRQLITIFSEENAPTFGFDAGIYGEDVVYEMGLTVYTSMDPIQQLAADKALRNGLEAATKRHGWLGPIQKLSVTEIEPYLANHPFEVTLFEKERWQKAIVESVTKQGAFVRIGDKKGYIPVREMGWARTPNKQINGLWQANDTKDATQVLSIGDLIWTSYKPTTKETAKLFPKDTVIIESLHEIPEEALLPLCLEQYPTVQGALASLEPQTGDVVALIGGYEFSYDGDQFNRATQAKRQIGSSFKPVVYASAIDHGFTAGSMILDAPIMLIDEYTGEAWRPGNFDGRFDGPMRLNRALARSRNLCTIRVAQEIGIEDIIAKARDLGFKEELYPSLATSLGAGTALPIDMASSYSAFANKGLRAIPRFIHKIEGPWGNTIYTQEPQHEEAISAQNAFVMAKLLQGVVQYGTATKLQVLEKPIAGKTGSTNEEIDAWFIGFTTDLVSATYVGFDQIEPMGRGETGTGAALPIYLEYARTALEHYPIRDFEMPEGIYFTSVDGISLPFYTGTSPRSGVNVLQDTVEKAHTKDAEDLLMQGF